MNFKFFSLIFSLLTILNLSAQIKKVNLKSGMIYSGYVIDKSKDSTTINTLSGNLIRLSNSDIDTITGTTKSKLRSEFKHAISPEKNKWFGLIEVNTRLNYMDEITLGAGIYGGYKFKSGISSSIGVSYLYGIERDLLRIASQNRYDFRTKASFPFLIGEIGLQKSLGDPKLYRHFYYQAGIGYCFKNMKGGSFLLSAGYSQSMRRYKVYDPNVFFPRNNSQIYYSDWFYYYEPFIKLAKRF